jgi:FkbM family methyltransferase
MTDQTRQNANDPYGGDMSVPWRRFPTYLRQLGLSILFETFKWFQRRQHWMQVNHLNVLDVVLENLNYRKRGDVSFIQIGAFDGVFFDPLRKHIERNGWHGILVEPQPEPFARLRENYSHQPQLRFENAAITATDCPTQLYLGKDVLSESNLTGKGKLSGKTITVPGITFKTLLERHKPGRVDLLQIDAEGLDDVILYQALGVCKPEVIHFEIAWLSIKRIKRLYNFLYGHNYDLYHGVGKPCDSIAVLRQLKDGSK